jgi:short subunit dehydrogenase-like uncharacterized protein
MHTNKNDRRPGHLTRNRHSFSFNHANFAGQTLSRWFGWLLGSKMVQSRLGSRIQASALGPTEAKRRQSRCFLWGEAMDEADRKVVARLQTPDAYDLTVQTSLAVADRVLSGTVSPGFQTPAMAFGPDFILEVAGVTRKDELID